MAEYIEREVAIDYIKQSQCKKCSDIGLCGNCAVLTGVRLFEEVPAADVAPVVRCKDCEYSYDEISYLCCSHGVCADCDEVPPNFYCAEGKRKEPD
jgi:hypothetical protein